MSQEITPTAETLPKGLDSPEYEIARLRNGEYGAKDVIGVLIGKDGQPTKLARDIFGSSFGSAYKDANEGDIDKAIEAYSRELETLSTLLRAKRGILRFQQKRHDADQS